MPFDVAKFCMHSTIVSRAFVFARQNSTMGSKGTSICGVLGFLLSLYALYVEHQSAMNPNYRALCDNSWMSCTRVWADRFAFVLLSTDYRAVHSWSVPLCCVVNWWVDVCASLLLLTVWWVLPGTSVAVSRHRNHNRNRHQGAVRAWDVIPTSGAGTRPQPYLEGISAQCAQCKDFYGLPKAPKPYFQAEFDTVWNYLSKFHENTQREGEQTFRLFLSPTSYSARECDQTRRRTLQSVCTLVAGTHGIPMNTMTSKEQEQKE